MLTATNSGGGSIVGTLSASGGNGGTNTSGAVAADGGSAEVAADLTAAGNVTINATLGPGGGGASSDSSDAGHGGSVIANAGSIIGRSTGGGNVSVGLLATGGVGGRAFGTGQAGDGTSINLTDVVDGETTGALTLGQRADAGSGGFGTLFGTAGDSHSEINKSGSFATLSVSSTAVGGGAQTGGNGGIGTSVVDATNDAGAVGIGVGARGGSGVGTGDGGAASATGTATTTGAGTNVIVNGISAAGGTSFGGTGGSGTSLGTASASGNGVVQIVGLGATGGNDFGGGTGGAADVTAMGSNVGTGSVSIVANSVGGSSTSGGVGIGGNATLNATGSGELGSVTVAATGIGGNGATTRGTAVVSTSAIMSSTTNGTGVGTADTIANGGGGSASSMAQASAGFTDLARGTANAPVAGNGSVVSTSDSLAGAVVKNPGPLLGPGGTTPQNEAVAYAAGDPNGVPGLNSIQNPNVWNAFLAVDNALGYGVLGGGAADSGSGASLVYTSMVEFEFDITASDGDLLIGLLDPVTKNNGFDSLHFQLFVEGNLEFDEIFATSGDATTFFDDQMLTVSDWSTGLVGVLDLKFQFDLTASTAGDGFYMNFVTGTVPVPPALWLFGSALGLLGWVRRKVA